MDNYLGLFDIFAFAFGAYFFSIFFRTKFMGKPINITNFMPTTMTMQNCKQPEAFTAYILPRLLVFSLFLMAYSAVSFFRWLDTLWFYLLFPAVVVLFYVFTVRRARRFWE